MVFLVILPTQSASLYPHHLLSRVVINSFTLNACIFVRIIYRTLVPFGPVK